MPEFDEYVMRSEFNTHSTVWHIIVGPIYGKKHASYRDGHTRDGRPYYLQHHLFNKDDYARNLVEEIAESNFDSDNTTFHVIR